MEGFILYSIKNHSGVAYIARWVRGGPLAKLGEDKTARVRDDCDSSKYTVNLWRT